ncbi:MAG: hypothetical protein ACLPH3_12510 [Terracidiphilus sp.]
MPKVRDKTTHGLPLFDRLLVVASSRGFSPAVSNIQQSLHIDDRLFGYMRRARTLQNIVNLSLGGDTLVDECPVLAIWTPYLRDLLDHADVYVKGMHLDPAQEAEFRRDTGGDPLQGIAKKAHAMEALLWPSVSEKDRKGYRRFLLLQAQILLAHVSVLDVAYAFSPAYVSNCAKALLPRTDNYWFSRIRSVADSLINSDFADFTVVQVYTGLRSASRARRLKSLTNCRAPRQRDRRTPIP